MQFREFLDIAEFRQSLHPTCRLVHKQHPVSNLQQDKMVTLAHGVPGMHIQQAPRSARTGKQSTPAADAPTNKEKQADDDSQCQEYANDFSASRIEHRE